MRRALAILAILAFPLLACGRGGSPDEPLQLAAAGSLAAPLRVACDSFTARSGVRVAIHSAGSLELARRLIELHEVPDVIALADEEIFPALLVPDHVDHWATFARNRVVVALAPDRDPAGIDSTNWWRALSRPDVEVGRSDPALDPAGYRALLVLRLAARLHGDTTIERAVLARSPARDVRPKSSDLIALLQTGALDYAFVYESSARAAQLRWISLGADVDLGDSSRAASYALASVTIPGKTRGSEVRIAGAPIRYALSVPRDAAHPRDAMRLADWLISADGRRVLRGAGLDATAGRTELVRQ